MTFLGRKIVSEARAVGAMALVCLVLAACGPKPASAPPVSPQPHAPKPPPVPQLEPGRVIETPHRAILGMGVNGDATRVLTGGTPGGDVIVWDLGTGKEMGRLKGHTDTVTSVAVTRDGSRAITGSRDKTVRVWDLAANGKLLYTLRGHQWPVLGVAISDDGRYGVSTSDGFILWDLQTGKAIAHNHGHAKTVWSAAFDNDHGLLYTGSWDGTMRSWTLPELKPVGVYGGHADRVKAIAVDPLGRFVATANTGDGDVRVWDPQSHRLIGKLRGHTDGVLSVAVSPDGKYIASGSGRILPDGNYDNAAADRTIRLWDVATGRELSRTSGHGAYVSALVFTPETAGILSAGGDSKISYTALELRTPDAPPEPQGDGPGTFLQQSAD